MVVPAASGVSSGRVCVASARADHSTGTSIRPPAATATATALLPVRAGATAGRSSNRVRAARGPSFGVVRAARRPASRRSAPGRAVAPASFWITITMPESAAPATIRIGTNTNVRWFGLTIMIAVTGIRGQTPASRVTNVSKQHT